MSDTMNILPHLLLPLTGPGEFPEDDMEKLLPDLKNMDEDKKRESDPGIRRMLLEALLQVIHMGFHKFVSYGVSGLFFANLRSGVLFLRGGKERLIQLLDYSSAAP